MNEPRYYFVGVPDIGKYEAAVKLHELVGLPAISGWLPLEEDQPVGLLADYRTEILVAAHRAVRNDGGLIYTLSLIDSLAYTAVRCSAVSQAAGNELDEQGIRWFSALGIITQMARDWNRDGALFLYIPLRESVVFDDDTRALDETLVAAMREYDVRYKTIDPTEAPETWLSN
jgi:hypothetical protein